jgi:hypothetical protein
METIEYDLPSCWASALINADPTELEDNEIAQLDAFLAGEGLGYCLGCSDESFFAVPRRSRYQHLEPMA